MSSTEVRIDSGGCLLAATYGEAAAPVAAALLIPGSGRVNRDSDARLQQVRQRVSPEVLRLITDWVTSRWARS